MIVALTHEQFYRLTGRLHGAEKLACLSLEFRRFVGAIGEYKRRSKLYRGDVAR